MYEQLHRRFEERIARFGVAIQVVTETIPGEGTFAYTIGHHRRRLPELIVFGVDPHGAARLLNSLSTLIRLGEVRAEPGREVPGQLGRGGRLPVRFGEVAPRWAQRHAVGVYLHHPDDDRDAIRVLQVVTPDLDGRFWDQPGFDASFDQVQPDLSRPEWPWRAALVPSSIDWELEVSGAEPWPLLVAVPIIEHGEDAGRREAVPARWVDDGHAVLQRPPVLADWVTVGTVVAVAPEPDPSTASAPIHRYLRVVRESPLFHAHWLVRADPEEDAERLIDTLEGLEEELGVTATLTPASMHIAAAPPVSGAVRARMRRLVRDGLAWEQPPYHASEPPDPTPGSCPSCP